MSAHRRSNPALSHTEADQLIADVFGRSAAQQRSVLGDLSAVDPSTFAHERFGRVLFPEQVDIIRMVWDLAIRQADVIAARQCGKTDAICVGALGAAAGNRFPTLEGHTAIGWFANKEDQSVGIGGARCWRLLEANYEKWKAIWDRDGSTKSHLVFKRDSGVNSQVLGTISFRTANPTAFSEGQTYSLIVIDEANRLDDIVWSEVILPMGASTNCKLIKIGVPRLRNNFYESANDKTWFHIRIDWTQASMYAHTAPAELRDPVTNALLGVYGVYPLRCMPLSLKRQLFPINPALHVLATKTGQADKWLRLWDWPGTMAEDDFRTQFCLEWLVDVSLFLKLEEQTELFTGGSHAPLPAGDQFATYFYGYDPCGEEAIDGFGGKRTKKANAALCVWRRTREGKLEKVWCDEKRDATPTQQVDWVEHMCHPKTGVFRCVAGCWDTTGLGISACNEAQRRGLPLLPVCYPRTCTETGRNWKNTIFDWFKLQVGLERVHYPDPATVVIDQFAPVVNPDEPSRHVGPGAVFRDHQDEWETVEKKVSAGANADIRAPGDKLDDGPNADCLAVWIADHYGQYRSQLGVANRATSVVTGPGVLGPAPAGPARPTFPIYLGL